MLVACVPGPCRPFLQYGYTATSIAAARGHTETVEALLKADPAVALSFSKVQSLVQFGVDSDF